MASNNVSVPNAQVFQSAFSDARIDMGRDGIFNIIVTPDRWIATIRQLGESAFGGFSFLTDLCGIHYPQQVGTELGVVVHLHNMAANHRVRVKVFVPVDRPVVPSLTGLFASANWMERETYDFFGIVFEGHPDLKRILNVDDMDYFPMRKEYRLEDDTRSDKNDAMFGR